MAEEAALNNQSSIYNVIGLLQQIRSCSWNPFKLNEIVKLERCLQEVVNDDPQVKRVIQKLMSDTVFVEPAEKLRYLHRTGEQKRADFKLIQETKTIDGMIQDLDYQIECNQIRFKEMSKKENEISMRIINSLELVCKLERSSAASYEKCQLLLERVQMSFERTLDVIQEKIPNFVKQIPESDLVKQCNKQVTSHRKLPLRLLKNSYKNLQQPSARIQFSYRIKSNIIEKLQTCLAALEGLYSLLLAVDNVYATELPEVIVHLKGFESLIECFEKPPPWEAPKKITVIRDDMTPVEQPTLNASYCEVIEDLEFNELYSCIQNIHKWTPVHGLHDSSSNSLSSLTGQLDLNV